MSCSLLYQYFQGLYWRIEPLPF